ncbi:hypothetical protein D5E78_25740 [Vibrio parahaemolyticus]|nr:hypothetical protein D5E78_25740 [Vibrio parahaemolyticus]
MKLKFDLKKKNGNARRGQLTFERGTVQTPAFMPVGTYGTVKGMTPESTLIMLVSAFAGYENTMNAYKHAVENKYRFFSYGDSMFIKKKTI